MRMYKRMDRMLSSARNSILSAKRAFLKIQSVHSHPHIPSDMIEKELEQETKHKKRSSSEITSSADWGLDPEELQQAFNQRTKAIIFNNPHNPYGKVFSEDEMLLISQLCEKWNVLCISDEVYEWLVYEPRKHIRIATLPGMWERTVTIGSAGKTFNVTGWKIGWTYGPHKLMYNIQFAQNNTVNVCNTPLQEALAIGLERELNRLHHSSCLFTSLLPTLETRKTYMVQLLVSLGLNPIIPEAGFFIVADCSSLATKVDLSSENDKCLDVRFTKWLIKNVGVVTIPCSEFYNEENKHIGEHLIRMCFIKKKTTVEAFGEKLIKWKAGLPE